MGRNPGCSVSIRCTVFISSPNSGETKPFFTDRLRSVDSGNAPRGQFLDGNASLFSAPVFISLARCCTGVSNRWLMDGDICVVHA